MAREARKIPFTAAQCSTIRMTALLMVPVGLIMLTTSVLKIIELVPVVQMLWLLPVIAGIQWLNALTGLAFGICLIVGAQALLSVARAGTVDALLRGFAALCVVYVIKIVLLVLAVVGVILAIVGVPLL